ncbi:MAG: carbamoyl-phosphate synthase small subunit [Bradymonadia bacterium]|jgi:carbamoyl-phosphate synthase small subunit
MSEPALIVLADGTWFSGKAFGAPTRSVGEVVFNTSMSGYQEILTDPSYRGQLVTMTSPHIGNYGVNELDVESDRIQVAGLIVREASRIASSYRATSTLHEYLQDAGVPAVTGVDTRALTRRIRDAGAVMGALVHGAVPDDAPSIAAELASGPQYGDLDYVSLVSTAQPQRVVLRETGDRYAPHVVTLVPDSGDWGSNAPLVVVIDYGVKYSILRHLADRGFRVLLVPHDTSVEAIMARAPAGVMLSNGPGDPGSMDGAVARVDSLLGKVPVFGICLGHQLLSRAIGGETFKLKFGHRGPNQPVLEQATGRVQITAQNHGYAVTLDNPRVPVSISYKNLNDGTIEGIEVPSLRAFSAQHHPEAAPGPHDAAGLFDRFWEMVEAGPS